MTIAAAVLALALAAQDAAIDADRPHVGTGPYVVSPGEVQLELGMLWQESADVRTFASPALMRVGVVDRIELRFSSDGLLARHEGTSDVYGVGNAQLGAKIRLWGHRDEPLFSMMPTIGFGLASREKGLGAGATDATVTWLIAHSIGPRVHAEGNYGVGAVGDRAGHFTQHLITGAVVVQTTARVQTYVESATWTLQERGGSPVSFFVYVVIAAIRPRLLVDAGAFAGVSAAAPNWGVFSGVSFAFAGRDVHEQLRRGARADRQRPVFRTQYN